MNKLIYLGIYISLFTRILFCEEINVIVAQDGSGDYTSIQEALDSAPINSDDYYTIFIKRGIYNEKIFIERSKIILIGENRDSTIITQSIARTYWRENHNDDWGAATINIKDGVTDIIIANLTAMNSFGFNNPDDPEANGHQFTIRGGGDRIILIDCNIISKGGDTVSLWSHGYYYHRNCYFEGGVDYVCPRGWCYITESKFFGHSQTASIWHDGSQDKDEKFVITHSHFDGVPNTALGRFHRDAQFFLLHCVLSENIQNQEIYHAESGPTLQWGKRVYYYDVHKENGNYQWHDDNICKAEGTPIPEKLTPKAVFKNSWDPESTFPSILERASMPKPANFSIHVDYDTVLQWIPGRDAVIHRVYLGTDSNPNFYQETTENYIKVTNLYSLKTYYWRVDEVTSDGKTIQGPIWSFKTKSKTKPPKPFNPHPENDATNVDVPIKKLYWDIDVTQIDSMQLFLGNNPDSLVKVFTYTVPCYIPGPLWYGKTYYWKIISFNEMGKTEGDLWKFKLKDPIYGTPDYYLDNQSKMVVIEAENFTAKTTVDDHYWEVVTEPSGYSGSGAIQALPDNGKFNYTGYSTKSPRVDYSVNFTEDGIYYLWVRAYKINSGNDLFHFGVNNEEQEGGWKLANFKSEGQWEWVNTLASPVLQEKRYLEIKALGIQAINLWMGDDGCIIDKIILTKDPNYEPEGLGPNATYLKLQEENQHSINSFSLLQNYPNPFNSSTVIEYTLNRKSKVDLSVYNIRGQKVATILNGIQNPGSYRYFFNVDEENLTSGIYFITIKTEMGTKSIKILFIK